MAKTAELTARQAFLATIAEAAYEDINHETWRTRTEALFSEILTPFQHEVELLTAGA